MAEPERAPKMQSYMKSEMPYYGVTAPKLRAAVRPLFKEQSLESFDDWRDTVLTMWREAKFREERYAAIELSGLRQYAPFQTLDALPIYEELIVTGAWWDYVDAVAAQRLARLLDKYPAKMKPTLRRWSTHLDMWKRRSSIICQVSFKERTDLELLYRCIEPNFGDDRFFIRKAIGWALRSYAWVDPDEIRRYVEVNRERMSGLSIREALKNLG